MLGGLFNALTHSYTLTYTQTHIHFRTNMCLFTLDYSLPVHGNPTFPLQVWKVLSPSVSHSVLTLLLPELYLSGSVPPAMKSSFFPLFAVHPSPHPSLWVSSRSLRPEDVRSRSLLNRASVTRRQAENDVLTWPGSVSKGNAGDSVTSRGQGYSAPLLNRRGQIKETVWTRHRLHHKDIIPR